MFPSKLNLKMPISVNTDPTTGNPIDFPIDKMINRTFHIYKEDTDVVRRSKERMTEIAEELLGKMLDATKGDGFKKLDELFADEHRQQKIMSQDLVFNALLGYPSKFKASVPISKIYATPDPYKIIKQLTVLTSLMPENATKFFIIKELTFQKYAHEISSICNIIVPQINGIQFYLNQENNLVCEFVMDKKDKLPLDFMLDWIDRNEENHKDKLLTFINGVKQSFNCLIDHAIHHNDSHSNNVFFLPPDTYTDADTDINSDINSDIPKICIIDFGKAMCSSTSPSTSGLIKLDEFEYSEETIENFKMWINILEHQNEYRKKFDERYGGKQNKKRKKKTYKKKSKNYRKKYRRSYKKIFKKRF